MSNKEFWESISSIINGSFDIDALNKLDYYAEQFAKGHLLFKRYTSQQQLGCTEGGRLHVIASLLSGAETPADQLSAPEGSFKREQQRAEAQAAIIEKWARSAECWVDDVDVFFSKAFGEHLAQGGEAYVYDNGNMIVKRIGLDYYIQPILALDRITLHNTIFPETSMTVLGFGKTTEGDFQVLVQQPFIHGCSMNDGEIREYAESLGFSLINQNNWTYANKDIYLSDMHDENVIRSPRGNIFVIDCDIRINTPELHCGGTCKVTNEIVWQINSK